MKKQYVGAASVARAWSGYVDSLLGGAVSNTTMTVVGEMHEQLLGRYPDFLAFAVCLSYACVLGKFINQLSSICTIHFTYLGTPLF